ncbi:hypothetical protein MKK69_22395 [Methylobacterium sp. J-026]|uniref:hypothetical protein n=1 Tax=Methylobacterium sp. J-026 TaxID=2836624 RepID=UPI001FBAE677|nr:hypothetical protein [Methylobacterium sp. J-026]MCJ2136764.1 hypothetical protein [Methylobacterium sp. J-026]
MDETERKIVTSLCEDGIYQAHLDDLSLDGVVPMLEQAQNVCRDIELQLAEASAHHNDPYLIQASKRELANRPEIYLFGLNEKLLQIVEGYLGLPVAFGGFNLFYTLADGRERGARVWHLDGEDESIVKIAIYLNDVDMDGGPFEMVRNRIFKGGRPYKRPVRHDKLERIVGKPIEASDIVTCVGRSGSVIFCDTARYYHRGRPATGKNRAAIFFNYYPRPPRRPYFCGNPIVALQDYKMSDQNLSHYQIQSALWREHLPAVAKYVLPR